MSRTHPIPSPLPTESAAGFVASLFRGTACIEAAFHEESGELQHLEKCWSDSAILQFILIGWIGLALKVLLFVLVATFVGACVQGRRPWYVFVSFLKGTGRVVGGLCSCFELDDEVRDGGRAGEAEKGWGIVWQEEKLGGGYFGSRKEKVRAESEKRSLTYLLTSMKGLMPHEAEEIRMESQQTILAREGALEKIERKEKQGNMSILDHPKYCMLQNASELEVNDWYKRRSKRKRKFCRLLQGF